MWILAALAFVVSTVSAHAANPYPTRPVRLLTPFAPGGAADAIARVLTSKLQESLGQPWVIDNRGGAGGNIAAEIVARAAPDGHTVFMGFSSVLTVNPLLYKLPFDVERAFLPVTTLTAGHYILVIHPSVKAENLKEFVSLAKGTAGPAPLRVVGRRHAAQPGGRAVQVAGGHSDDPRAL